MKKTITAILCTVLALIMLTGCVSINFSPMSPSSLSGRGSPETFTFNVNEITEIRVELLCNIIYRSAPSDTVTLQVQPNLMEYITVEENNGILTVRSNRNFNVSSNTNTPVLTVSTPSLSRISHMGAGILTTEDPINTDSFSLDIAGAASGNLTLDVSELSVSIAGAGDLNLSGTADIADINMAGAGRLNALDLDTRESKINMAGAGSVRIGVSDNLKVSAGGVGTVEYRGNPTLDITRGGLVTVRSVS